MNKLKVVDLCSGTGAFTQTFKQFDKFEVVFANDYIKESEDIYKLNHGDGYFIYDNIHNLEVDKIPQHDLLCAGFPCQAFSIAGYRKGFADERSNVFWKIIEILETHMPEYIILENVKNLQSHDKGNTFKIIKSHLEELGYFLKFAILNTSTITGIPHNRERIYIVGFQSEEEYDKFNFDFDTVPTSHITEFLLNPSEVEDKYYYTDRYKMFDTIKESITKHIDEGIVYQYRRYYVRENKSNVCPTLTANMGSGGHNVPLILDDGGIRKLTPRECFNLQGFPLDYKLPNISDSKLYKLAGNAITIPVLRQIVLKLDQLN